MKIAVLGTGAWGTTLAKLLDESGRRVTLWGRDPAHLAELSRTGRNDRYLPGVQLSANWDLETNLERAVSGRDCIILAVPSKVFRGLAERLPNFSGIAISATKGLEYHTGLTMCGILAATMPNARPVAMSGPTFALEVAQGMPAAIVAAGTDPLSAQFAQEIFHRPAFRVYTSEDVIGVELGGALKNVVAIGAGVCDGIGFGDNTKAALITRAVAEIRRLGVACGAQAETFSGLSGLGDLTATCFSKLSRNRELGERIGRGENLETILADKHRLAEGYPTARSAFELARKTGVETPIINEVHAMLYESKDVAQAVRDLTGRDSKAED